MSSETGETICSSTGTELSRAAADELSEIASTPASADSSPPSSSHRRGGRWRCPADVAPMVQDMGLITCVSCDRRLPGSLVYQLIEVHDHPR